MSKSLFTDKTFDHQDYSGTPLPDADFEACRFLHCNFAGADLSGINFTECGFDHCNLSSAKIIQTVFNDVKFINSKMLGLHFEATNPFLFTVQFDGCTLDLSSFYQCKMKKTVFTNCSLQETDFTETVLTEAVFSHCNLRDARFEQTQLEKADLRTALNYTLDPELNRIRKARFSYPAVIRLLDKYDLLIS
ncbi:MAG: pentapeptide repeat-containing protein [Sphingobacteriales bacterium]|nr:pentapeptide repeat-containing protein [Sphingobacteriales bacterium]